MTSTRTLPFNTIVVLFENLGEPNLPLGRVARPSRAEQDTGLDEHGPHLARYVLVEWATGERCWEPLDQVMVLPGGRR